MERKGAKVATRSSSAADARECASCRVEGAAPGSELCGPCGAWAPAGGVAGFRVVYEESQGTVSPYAHSVTRLSAARAAGPGRAAAERVARATIAIGPWCGSASGLGGPRDDEADHGFEYVEFSATGDRSPDAQASERAWRRLDEAVTAALPVLADKSRRPKFDGRVGGSVFSLVVETWSWTEKGAPTTVELSSLARVADHAPEVAELVAAVQGVQASFYERQLSTFYQLTSDLRKRATAGWTETPPARAGAARATPAETRD